MHDTSAGTKGWMSLLSMQRHTSVRVLVACSLTCFFESHIRLESRGTRVVILGPRASGAVSTNCASMSRHETLTCQLAECSAFSTSEGRVISTAGTVMTFAICLIALVEALRRSPLFLSAVASITRSRRGRRKGRATDLSFLLRAAKRRAPPSRATTFSDPRASSRVLATSLFSSSTESLHSTAIWSAASLRPSLFSALRSAWSDSAATILLSLSVSVSVLFPSDRPCVRPSPTLLLLLPSFRCGTCCCCCWGWG
mmetsp:Transcript_13937/g.25823  ORF Transcript_13937/g.25823 Transcript_13937/m.25823 type:complete len:255 (+) Transcript_13937:2656-3420(+)